ncbi:helix-turn-helix domain-containing protein [Patescibacteria group bacterium]|nr:helix-turn-helix domain-containing protein [Patescibacteria group bacterium]
MNKFKFNKKTDNLFKAILSIKTVTEAEKFFRDLCTVKEIKEMSERLTIAQLVNVSMPYREIAQKLKVSSTTVSRVSSWLNNGEGGYKLILNRLNSQHHNSSIFKKS